MGQGLTASVDQSGVGEWAKITAAVVAILSATVALLSRFLRRRREERNRQALESKAIRYLLDATRHSLGVLVPRNETHLIVVDELIRQKVLIDGVRDALWVADGNISARVSERAAQDIVRVLTRTQAIQAKKEQMFADGWTGDK